MKHNSLYVLLALYFLIPTHIFAADFFTPTITASELRSTYNDLASTLALTEAGVSTLSSLTSSETPKKINILIVPGHDDDSSGAVFDGVREADINLEVAHKLKEYFAEDSHFNVVLARTESGYHKGIETYFTKQRRSVELFRKKHATEMKKLIKKEKIEPMTDGVLHNAAASDVVVKLYAINKWSNDNAFDIVLHVHFNDYANRIGDEEGIHTGFAIYVPEKQYSNAEASIALAKEIRSSIETLFPVSSLPGESAGVVEDQELIAIGANNTVEAASLLLEYGYLYEPQFTHSETRPAVTTELAHQTYTGVKRFFEPSYIPDSKTTLLPHTWSTDMEPRDTITFDALALQAALTLEGVYPPEGYSRNDCTLRGEYGDCTKESVRAFQNKYALPVTGIVGPLTRAKLNEVY